MAENRQEVPLHQMVADMWRTLRHALFDTYRPERHYMRGPGPKWHAKHARPAPVATAATDAVGAAA